MRHLLLASTMAITVALAVPASAEGVLSVGMAAPDIGQVDPHKATTTQDKPMTGWLFNGLVRFPPGSDDLGALEPDLAESWEKSDDGLEWTFHLREGVKFHHGYGELTAEDVVFSLNRAANPDTSSFSGDYAAFEKVEALDDKTVKITLSAPVPSLLGLVANYHGGNIVSKKAVEELGADFTLKAVGTGPFMVGEYSPQESITFDANPDYFRGKPKLDQIVYRFIPSDSARDLAMQSGELDVVYGRQDQQWIERVSAMDGVSVDVVRPAELQNIHFNMSMPPLDDIAVRKAIATAIDRQQFVDFLGDAIAKPAQSIIPAGNLGFAPQDLVEKGDPAKAKQMLADAGYPDGITLKMIQTSLPSMLSVAQVLQAQLAEAGITLDLEVVDHQTFHANIRKDLSQVVYYSAARFPVADVYLTQFFHPRSIVGTPTAATNFSHCDVAGDEIDAARVEQNAQKQLELWKTAQQKIVDEVCAVPLHEQLIAWAKRDNVDYGYDLKAAMHLGPIINENTTVSDE